ncbi:MAG: pyrroline-5-carboxylate reductase family protein [Alphaproteobacteria bacterium]
MLATLKPNILFIGYGHLAKSLLSTSLRRNYNINYINSQNTVFSINSKKKIKQKNISYKYIFLLIKPDIFLKKTSHFKNFISQDSKIISCMAGIKLITICNNLGHKNVIRIMPNVMAKQNKSQTFVFAKNKKILNRSFDKLIKSFGSVHYTSNEDQINIATSIFGSGPAFIAYLIKSYIVAAKNLSKKNQLKDIDLMNLFHNVLSANENSKDLDFFLNSIASKKGTTQAGVNFLKSQNINKIIYTTLDRAYKRAKEIGIEK